MALSYANVRPVSKETFDEELSKVLRDENEPVMKTDLEHLDAFILHGVFSEAECESFVAKTEALRYTFWNQSAPDVKNFRNADTVEVNDVSLAEGIWKRIQHLVVPEVSITSDEERCERGLEGTWRAVGVNHNLLFARYGPGGHFSPHTDGYTIVDLNKRSLYSLLLYLNTCSVGGATRMFPPDDQAERHYDKDDEGRMRWSESSVVARAPVARGTALAFYQNIPHEGEPVGDGEAKYIIRTDIMYEVR